VGQAGETGDASALKGHTIDAPSFCSIPHYITSHHTPSRPTGGVPPAQGPPPPTSPPTHPAHRRFGPVFRARLLGANFHVVAEPDLVKEMFTTKLRVRGPGPGWPSGQGRGALFGGGVAGLGSACVRVGGGLGLCWSWLWLCWLACLLVVVGGPRLSQAWASDPDRRPSCELAWRGGVWWGGDPGPPMPMPMPVCPCL
jgi:hypothetical protein